MYLLVVWYYNCVGVFVNVMDGLRVENVNVEEMENIVFVGGKVVCCML